MTPVAQLPHVNGDNDSSHVRFDSWLEEHGEAEYHSYRNDDTISALSYEEWTKSDHVLGPYLLHVTMGILNEPSSNEDEMSEVEVIDVVPRRQRMSTRPKSVTTNGYGMRQAAKSSESNSRENQAEATGPAKRKKKPKKHSLSQEIVKSDESGIDDETPNSARRKSGGRKKKYFLSDALIAPEDMDDDDATSVDANATTTFDANATTTVDPAKARQPEPETLIAANHTKRPPGKNLNRKYLTFKELITGIPDEEEQYRDPPPMKRLITPPILPRRQDGLESLSASRRGLRARTAAQQNPYQHHARLFEDQLEDRSNESGAETPPKRRKQTIKLKNTSRPIEEGGNETLVADEDEILAEQSEDMLPKAKRAYYKGKGRAWKKTEEDEDEEFMTKTKVKPPTQAKRVAGRRKSSAAQLEDDNESQEATRVTREIVRGESVAVQSPSMKPPRKKPGPKPGFKKFQNTPGSASKGQGVTELVGNTAKEKTPKIKKEKAQNSPVTTPGSSRKPAKQKSGSRKSQTLFLSEEYVVDSSDTDTDQQKTAASNGPVASKMPPRKPTGKPRGRPRKSDQSTLSKEMVDSEDDAMSIDSGGKLSTPVPTTSGANGLVPSPVNMPEEPVVEAQLKPNDEKEMSGPMEVDGQAQAIDSEAASG